MVANSDERQWGWMDEDLNTFPEYVVEVEWEETFPAFGGHTNLLDATPTYMTSSNQVPIMTNSESILQFDPNAYRKSAAALTVLRETVMGRERSTSHSSNMPSAGSSNAPRRRIFSARWRTCLQRMPALNDMYNDNDPYTASNEDKNGCPSYIKKLEDWEQDALVRGLEEAPFIYFVDFSNLGGLVPPLPLVISYADGSSRELMLAAEIWRLNANNITRVMMETKAVSNISLDERHQTADADFSNNQFPQRITRSRLALYKSDKKRRDLMADMLVELKGGPKDGESADDKAVPLVPSSAP